MGIGDFTTKTGKIENHLPKAEIVTQYCEQYMMLCAKYKEEIEYIYNKLNELANERMEVIQKYKEMHDNMKKEGIHSDAIDKWLMVYLEDTKRSLDISENMLNNFYVLKLSEFRNKIEEIQV